MEKQPEIVPIEEVAERLGVNRSTVYAGVKRGDLPGVTVGRRTVIPRPAFERMMDTGSFGGQAVNAEELAADLRRESLILQRHAIEAELARLEGRPEVITTPVIRKRRKRR